MSAHPIPDAALSQHIAVLGKNGSGKTYAAKAVIVEPLLAAGKRVAIVDPTSAWWGLRTSADGRTAGFKVLVLGGDHGDLPLPVHGGAAVARLIVEQGVDLVADTGDLTVGERTRWMIDFAGTLYRLNRAPLHLVIDEAHVFAPQGKVPDPDTGRMLHAVNQVAAGGRSRGIRLTMLTQRPQKLHKDTLTTADTLIAMRVLAPQDREAVKAWIDGCGNQAQGREVLDSLAQLQRGEGWIWYPEGGVLTRTRFPAINTFDSSATPKEGDAVIVAPRGAAEIDLTEIKAALADAAKEAEENDPKRLRARIAELERELATPHQRKVDIEGTRRRAKIEGYAAAIAALLPMTDRLQTLRTALDEQLGDLLGDLAKWRKRHEKEPAQPVDRAYPKTDCSANVPPPVKHPRQFDNTRPSASSGGDGAAKQRIMVALAENPAGLTPRKLAIIADVKRSGSTWRAAMAALRRADALAIDTADKIALTKTAIASLGSYTPLPKGKALREYWLAQMGERRRAVLAIVFAAYPHSVPAKEVAQELGITFLSSTWRAHMAKLRGLELITGSADLKASAELFE